MSRFTDMLLVSPLPDGRTWVIQRDFGYDVGSEGSAEAVDVPIGFKTDFTSVPRFLWSLLPQWGTYGHAAVIHDFCYWHQHYSRKRSDEIFREAMKVLQVKPWKRAVIYYSVRWFGWLVWWRNQRRKRNNPKLKLYYSESETRGFPWAQQITSDSNDRAVGK